MLKLGPIGRALLRPEQVLQIDTAEGARHAVIEKFGENVWNEFAVKLPAWLVPSWFAQVMIGGGEGSQMRLARGLSSRWRFFRATDRQILRERAKKHSRSLPEEKAYQVLLGIHLAAEDRERPQNIRLGRQWVVDDDGHKAVLAPADLWAPEAIRWFAASALAAATATLRDESWPESTGALPETVPLDDAIAIADVTGTDSLSALIAAQEEREQAHAIATVYSIATEKERELLDFLEAADSIKEAAEALGIKPNAAQQRLFRLRAKISQPAG